MIRRRTCVAPILALFVALSGVGCGEQEVAAPPEPMKSQEEMRQEAEAARRQELTTALAARAAELEAAATALSREVASPEELPEELAAELEAVAGRASEAEQLLAELQAGSGEQWEAARQRLEAALGELETAREEAAAAAGAWKERQVEALAAREESGSPVDAKTGLIEGLDGGEYDQYLVSVVETVQARLRRHGLYAGPVDGVFGVATREAVGAFQEREGLHVSGVPSPMTRERLFRA